MTIEHIIPVWLLSQLGLVDAIYDDEENFALYCRSCNAFKGGRVDISHPKTIPLLKKYVEML